jgi:hypothetical protein
VTAESNGSVSRSILVDGLNPGANAFTAKYRSNSGPNVFFSHRNLTAIAL